MRVSSRVLNVNPGLELPYCINHVSYKPLVFSPFISSRPSKYLHENMGIGKHAAYLAKAYSKGAVMSNLWHFTSLEDKKILLSFAFVVKIRFTWGTYFTSLLWASALKSPIRNAAPLNWFMCLQISFTVLCRATWLSERCVLNRWILNVSENWNFEFLDAFCWMQWIFH